MSVPKWLNSHMGINQNFITGAVMDTDTYYILKRALILSTPTFN